MIYLKKHVESQLLVLASITSIPRDAIPKEYKHNPASSLIQYYSRNHQNNHLLEQIDPELGASRIHNQVADQMSESEYNESMKQTQQDEFCIKPVGINRQIR